MMYDFQRALLLLYTNESFLSRFMSDPENVLSEFKLTDREQRTLRELPFKKLSLFRQGLHYKRLSVAKKTIANGNMISLIAFWKDSPAIMWGSPQSPHTVAITEGMARMLRELFLTRTPISLQSIFRARLSVAEKTPLRDVVSLVRLVLAHRLIGKTVFAG